jgi:DASS family divalent anion:Na+ symporter
MALAAIAVLGLLLWSWPPPDGLTVQAWRLFALFATAITAVVSGVLPILTASLLAGGLAVLTGVMPAAHAWAGFSNGTILLIVVAFLVARGVVTCGLGTRIGHLAVSVFGRSTLGLCYSIFLLDAVIAPAFPSSTARSGVLYPLAASLVETGAGGATPETCRHPRLAAFLMFSGMASFTLSSALWLTAMAGNPLGAAIASRFGVHISFGSWLLASSVPTLSAMVLLPLALYAVMSPEVKATPEAPRAARDALARLGPLSRKEWIVALTFVTMVTLWASASVLSLDATAVALIGLAVFLVTGVITPRDIAKEGDVLATFMWFALLFALSTELNELGFMAFVGQKLAHGMLGMRALYAGTLLVVVYVLLHYLFVSQTAHLLAMFGTFLDVGVRVGVPAMPLAFMLLFATNFFSAITPQASSANLLFASSGYLSQGQLYRFGALTTAINLVIYVVIGIPWLVLLSR